VLIQLDPNVIRVPVLPGVNPKIAYGDLVDRGIRGIVLEAYGVGNLPDIKSAGAPSCDMRAAMTGFTELVHTK
jgi:L-asparaginase/Glu-tRNA(Gln) amidotransferase subunit D